MSFEIGAANPVAINARADLAALQTGAAGTLAKISSGAKAAEARRWQQPAHPWAWCHPWWPRKLR